MSHIPEHRHGRHPELLRLDRRGGVPHPVGMEGERAEGRIASLDVLRLLACALVILQHGAAFLAGSPSLPRFIVSARFGAIGVQVFFAISGFVITRLLLRERAAGLPLRLFMMRRAVRIFPAYYALLLATTALTLLYPLFGVKGLHWSQWCYAFNIVASLDPSVVRGTVYGHVWSLCVEEHFYLVWPLLVAWLTPRRSRVVMLGVLLPLSLASVLLLRGDRLALNLMTPTSLLTLGAGSLMAYHEPWARSRTSRPWAAALVGLALLTLLWPGSTDAAKHMGRAALAGGVVLAAVSVRRLAGARLTDVGTMTYGVYLCHPLALSLAARWMGGWAAAGPAGLLVGVLLTWALAGVSYGLMERPLIRWAGRRFRARATPASATARRAPALAPTA